MLPFPVAAVAVAVTAIPPTGRAIKALGERRLSVDLLDVAAIGISVATGQPATGAFITWLLGVGDLVLERTHDRARHAISKLMKLDASDAWRVDANGDVEKVAVKRLAVGDHIVVEAGGRVPADGIVVKGVASVDEKALTGESIPKERGVGERVLAATVVVDGQVVVEVDRVGGDTTAAKIVQILEGAGAKPMTLQRHAERVADKLVLPTFGVAGAAAMLASQIDRATSVLITDFGTGIRICVPTSALTAMTLAAREGVLVKGGQFLERLAKADVIVFDKTGTLTLGEPVVREVRCFGKLGADEVMALAAAAEERQRHPVAQAIREHASKQGLAVPDADLGSEEYAIGIGLRARVDGRDVAIGGKRLMAAHGVWIAHAQAAVDRNLADGISSIYVAVDGALEAVVAYSDAPRMESAAVVKALRAGGRREVILLSGDAREPVEAVGRAVGVDRAIGELLPEQKARHVKELQRAGKIVAMVGDGINDAPALALADVGISLDGGADVALETADVVLLEGGLAKLPEAFAIADRAMAHVRRGLGLVIAPNAVAIALGALGLISPGVAAVVNNGSTVVAALAAVSPLLPREPGGRRSNVLPCYQHGSLVETMSEAVRKLVARTSYVSGAIAVVLSPIPLADEIAFLPVFGVMAARIAKTHGLAMKDVPWRPIATTTLAALAARATVNLAVSYIPGVAAVANAVSAVTLTRMLGSYVDEACAQPKAAQALSVKEIVARMKDALAGQGPRPASPPEAFARLRAALYTPEPCPLRCRPRRAHAADAPSHVDHPARTRRPRGPRALRAVGGRVHDRVGARVLPLHAEADRGRVVRAARRRLHPLRLRPLDRARAPLRVGRGERLLVREHEPALPVRPRLRVLGRLS